MTTIPDKMNEVLAFHVETVVKNFKVIHKDVLK